MYERSAIILERYFNSILGMNQDINLRTVYMTYRDLVKITKEYEILMEAEDKVIGEFDEIASEIRTIQQDQGNLYRANIKLEEERNQLFSDFDEDSLVVEKKLKRIESIIRNNNSRLFELREEFIKTISKFNEKQKERNKAAKTRRLQEKEHLHMLEVLNEQLTKIDKRVVENSRRNLAINDNYIEQEIINKMLNNGKGERIPFNEDVIRCAVRGKKEIIHGIAECYIHTYDRAVKLLIDINNDDINMKKHEKFIRDTSIKVALLNAENTYITSFLDFERMTAINGKKAHDKLMEEACYNFNADMSQFKNLYNLALKEIIGKATKKNYEDLYNKEYIKNIEEKEENFEKEMSNITYGVGSFINSNFWRIQEIKNVYEVYQNEITIKIGRDLSQFQLEEYRPRIAQEEDGIFKTDIQSNDDEYIEYVEEYEFDEDQIEKDLRENEKHENKSFLEDDEIEDEFSEYENYDKYSYEDRSRFEKFEDKKIETEDKNYSLFDEIYDKTLKENKSEEKIDIFEKKWEEDIANDNENEEKNHLINNRLDIEALSRIANYDGYEEDDEVELDEEEKPENKKDYYKESIFNEDDYMVSNFKRYSSNDEDIDFDDEIHRIYDENIYKYKGGELPREVKKLKSSKKSSKNKSILNKFFKDKEFKN